MTIVEARGLTRAFAMHAGPVMAVRDVSLKVEPGDYVAIGGPSGCGKSTLLHLLGCVDTPSAGSVWFDGRDVGALGDSERGRIRLTRIGFVFQRFFLLPMLTAWENVELPQAEARVAPADRRARTRALLEYVGLAGRAITAVAAVGRRMQRVAVARALANRPAPLRRRADGRARRGNRRADRGAVRSRARRRHRHRAGHPQRGLPPAPVRI